MGKRLNWLRSQLISIDSGLRTRIENSAWRRRELFDGPDGRRAPVLRVGALAGLAAGAGWLVGQHAWNGCRVPRFSFFDFELTFSPRTFASLLTTAGKCKQDVLWTLVSSDILFPLTYAFSLSALYLWAERYRRYNPGKWKVDPASLKASMAAPEPVSQRALPFLSAVLVLLPFAIALIDVVVENVPLVVAGGIGPKSPAFNWFVMIGSYGAATKWALLAVFGLGLIGMVFSGPRGIVVWRLRYSVLAVLLGALPLLLIPQGQEILQRLVEGERPEIRVALAVLVLAATALVIWYCARTLSRVRISHEADDTKDPWFGYFEREIPRIVGIGLLLLTGMAFARAGLAVERYAGIAVGAYVLVVLLASFWPGILRWLGRMVLNLPFVNKAARDDELIADRFGRAVLGVVASVLIIWPAAVNWTPIMSGHLPRITAPFGSEGKELFYLRFGAALLVAVTWALYLFVYFRRDFAVLRETKDVERLQLERQQQSLDSEAGFKPPNSVPVHVRRYAKAAGVVSLAFFVLFTWDSVRVGRFLGPLIILAVATANAVFFGSMLSYLGRKYRLHLVALLLVLAAAFSAWNDNHAIRLLPATEGDSTQALMRRLDNRLSGWLTMQDSMQDSMRRLTMQDSMRPPKDSTIPLVLVAAAGGGLRAAYWTGAALGMLQDRDSSFARHVFAISGVSGGSIGASVFMAMIHDRVINKSAPHCATSLAKAQGRDADSVASVGQSITQQLPPSVATCVRRVMADDFLSPVLAKLAAPDLLQWFLPIPFKVFDRSIALEQSWEESYATTMDGRSTMELGFRQLQPDSIAAKGVPSLLLNSTQVQTGRRYIAAPFDTSPSDTPTIFFDAPTVYAALGSDVRLSTAAHNSARFTYVSPPGRIEREDGKSYGGLVDGGYFENSGLATLNELRRAIVLMLAGSDPRFASVAPRVKIVVLYLCNDPLSCRHDFRAEKDLSTKRSSLGEWLSPFRAALAARNALGSLASGQTANEVGVEFLQMNVCDSLSGGAGGTSDGNGPIDSLTRQVARERVVNPPLGWLLSSRARRWMDSSLVLDSIRSGRRVDFGSLARGGNCRAQNALAMNSLIELLRNAH